MFLNLILFYIVFTTIIQQNDCKKNLKNEDIKVVGGSCSKHEQFSSCGSDCGHTCDDIAKKEIKCSKNCTKGCFCEKKYYRDFKRNGRCVRSNECKSVTTKITSRKFVPKCASNQEYKCSSDCGKYCEDIGKNVKCRDTCESGCYCKEGYYWDSRVNGHCIKEKHCKKKKQKKYNSKRKEFVEWFKRHFPWKNK